MKNEKIVEIQEALLIRGFMVGEVDGVLGRRTIAALKAFQRGQGLSGDGIFGPKTGAALFAEKRKAFTGAVLPWVVEGESLMGTQEIAGSTSNPLILDWADDLDLHYGGDDIPWCGLFVAHCIGATMTEEVLPSNPLGARGWDRFGDATAPRLGAIMVFWRVSLAGSKGHVGFYTGEDAKAYRILGGNQSDKVCLAWIAKDRLLKARWPRTASVLDGGEAIVFADRTPEVSLKLA